MLIRKKLHDHREIDISFSYRSGTLKKRHEGSRVNSIEKRDGDRNVVFVVMNIVSEFASKPFRSTLPMELLLRNSSICLVNRTNEDLLLDSVSISYLR